jgi:hypothetical protein
MNLPILKKIGFYTVGALTITLGAIYITPLSEYVRQQSGETTQPSLRQKPASKKSFIANQDEQQTNRLEKHISRNRIESTSSLPEKLVLAFNRIQLIGHYFNREALIEQEILTLLETQGTLEEAQHLLLNRQYAKTTYGENQAEARVYAIKMLEIQAKHLNPEPLIATTATLASQLNDAIISNDPLSQNPLQDLEDLLRLSIQYFDSINEFEEPGDIANRLNYQSHFHPKIKEKYDDALFFPLLRRFGREKASKIVANILEG